MNTTEFCLKKKKSHAAHQLRFFNKRNKKACWSVVHKDLSVREILDIRLVYRIHSYTFKLKFPPLS